MTKSYEIETMCKVFDNNLGVHIKVLPDTDGLGLVEIDGGEHFGGNIRLLPEMALLLAKAINQVSNIMLVPSPESDE